MKEDGTKIAVDYDGSWTMDKPDGTHIVGKHDGSWTMKDPSGKVTAVEYDGTPSPKDGTVVAPQVPAKPNIDVKDPRTPISPSK